MLRLSKTLTTGALLAAISATDLWADGKETYGHHDMMGSGWGSMVFGPLMMIIFIAAIAVIVVVAIRWLGGNATDTAAKNAPSRSPVDILKERFARGEIDLSEFEERRQVLEQ